MKNGLFRIKSFENDHGPSVMNHHKQHRKLNCIKERLCCLFGGNGKVHWKNIIAKRNIFWSSEPENIAIRPMLRYCPRNYTITGDTAILVFQNVILLREGYKFVDMTTRCTTVGKNKGEFLIYTSRANRFGQTLLFLCWSYCYWHLCQISC